MKTTTLLWVAAASAASALQGVALADGTTESVPSLADSSLDVQNASASDPMIGISVHDGVGNNYEDLLMDGELSEVELEFLSKEEHRAFVGEEGEGGEDMIEQAASDDPKFNRSYLEDAIEIPDVQTFFTVDWLASEADELSLTLAYLMGGPKYVLLGDSSAKHEKDTMDYTAEQILNVFRGENFDERSEGLGIWHSLRRESWFGNGVSNGSQDSLGLALPCNTQWGTLDIVSHAENLPASVVTEYADPESDLEYTDEAMAKTFEQTFNLENRLHKMTKATVVVADYDALVADFGTRRICGKEMCSKDEMDRFLLDSVAYLTDCSFNMLKESESFEGSGVEEEVAKMIAVRPYNYGRALQFDDQCCGGELLARGDGVEARDGEQPPGRLVSIALEAKGVGLSPRSCKDTSALESEYGSGTISLAECLREFAIFSMLKVISTADPEMGADVVPSYAVIDAGYDIPKFGKISRATGRRTRRSGTGRLTCPLREQG